MTPHVPAQPFCRRRNKYREDRFPQGLDYRASGRRGLLFESDSSEPAKRSTRQTSRLSAGARRNSACYGAGAELGEISSRDHSQHAQIIPITHMNVNSLLHPSPDQPTVSLAFVAEVQGPLNESPPVSGVTISSPFSPGASPGCFERPKSSSRTAKRTLPVFRRKP